MIKLDQDEKKFGRFWIYIVILILITITIFGTFKFFSKPFQVIDKATDPDHIITSYENFQDLYNSCKQVCIQITTLNTLPNGHVSGNFTKEDRIIAESNRLAKLVEQYNSDSRKLNKNKWKNPNLPYQLTFKTICDENY